MNILEGWGGNPQTPPETFKLHVYIQTTQQSNKRARYEKYSYFFAIKICTVQQIENIENRGFPDTLPPKLLSLKLSLRFNEIRKMEGLNNFPLLFKFTRGNTEGED